MQHHVPTIQTVLKTVGNLQVQFLDRVANVPVVTVRPPELCTVTTDWEEIHFWIVWFSAA